MNKVIIHPSFQARQGNSETKDFIVSFSTLNSVFFITFHIDRLP